MQKHKKNIGRRLDFAQVVQGARADAGAFFETIEPPEKQFNKLARQAAGLARHIHGTAQNGDAIRADDILRLSIYWDCLADVKHSGRVELGGLDDAAESVALRVLAAVWDADAAAIVERIADGESIPGDELAGYMGRARAELCKLGAVELIALGESSGADRPGDPAAGGDDPGGAAGRNWKNKGDRAEIVAWLLDSYLERGRPEKAPLLREALARFGLPESLFGAVRGEFYRRLNNKNIR